MGSTVDAQPGSARSVNSFVATTKRLKSMLNAKTKTPIAVSNRNRRFGFCIEHAFESFCCGYETVHRSCTSWLGVYSTSHLFVGRCTNSEYRNFGGILGQDISGS